MFLEPLASGQRDYRLAQDVLMTAVHGACASAARRVLRKLQLLTSRAVSETFSMLPSPSSMGVVPAGGTSVVPAT
jgi:hypothetical protein